MEEDDRVRAVKVMLFDHLSSHSQRHVRDAWAIHMLAKEIVQKLDHREGVWRKWNEAREALVKSATHCWIPIDDLREYLNGMPGPALTRMDVAQRLRAFQDDPCGDHLNDELKAGCLAIFEREKAEGTELPAVIGAIQEWGEQEEVRQWQEREAARQRQIEEERVALEQRILSGADCKWTPLNKSVEVYCRMNGRTYRYRVSARRSYEWALRRRQELQEELARCRAEAARKAREARIAAEKARRSQLLAMAADLRAADDIRALVARVVAKRAADDEAASRWGAWALDVADRLDPSGRLVIDRAAWIDETEPIADEIVT